MNSVWLPRLVWSACLLVLLAAHPTMASAQACGAVPQALEDARDVVQALTGDVAEALADKIKNPNVPGVDLMVQDKEAALNKAEARLADLERRTCFDFALGVVKTSSINGAIVRFDFDQDVKDFYLNSPQALKVNSFALDGAQAPAVGRPRNARAHFLLGFVGEAGFDHGDGATLLGFLGGVRVTVVQLSPKLAPFGQFLVGVEHCGLCQYTAFSLQPGFGVKYAIRQGLGLVAQLDFRLVPSSENEIRFSGGLSIPIGK